MSATLEEPLLAAPPEPLPAIRVRAKFFFEGERKFFLKGVTYGPFAPDAEGHFVGNPEQARRDMELIRGTGNQSAAALPRAAEVVSRSLPGVPAAGADFHSMGRARGVSQ